MPYKPVPVRVYSLVLICDATAHALCPGVCTHLQRRQGARVSEKRRYKAAQPFSLLKIRDSGKVEGLGTCKTYKLMVK